MFSGEIPWGHTLELNCLEFVRGNVLGQLPWDTHDDWTLWAILMRDYVERFVNEIVWEHSWWVKFLGGLYGRLLWKLSGDIHADWILWGDVHWRLSSKSFWGLKRLWILSWDIFIQYYFGTFIAIQMSGETLRRDCPVRLSGDSCGDSSLWGDPHGWLSG